MIPSPSSSIKAAALPTVQTADAILLRTAKGLVLNSLASVASQAASY